MCGIAGSVDFTRGEPLAHVLAAMAHSLRRRGPDGSGTLIDGACGLAHRRLSIIDLAGSPQPMQVPGSDVSLVYNGELYNYKELRTELERQGESFVTNGDTEVLLRWVGQAWQEALPQFDGMFAFAAWDRRRERMLLARDPIGEKPLFYAIPSPGILVFGSEIKALLGHPGIDIDIDIDSLRQALRFRAVYGARSLYRGVRQLEPGTYLDFSRDGLRIGRFFNLVDQTEHAGHKLAGWSDSQIVEHGGRLFEESVRQRLIADVPIGAFLSGGLDSSLIVALMRRLQGPDAQIHTFSVGFNDPSSELPHAKIVAGEFNTHHTEIHVSEQDYISRLSELTACRDAPISEPADIAIAQMSRMARHQVKVVLSGEGADEVFGGYPKYGFAGARFLGTALRALGPNRAAWVAGKIGVDRRRVLVAANALVLRNEVDHIAQWFSYLERQQLRSLLPGLDWGDFEWAATMDPQRTALAQAPSWSQLARMQLADCLTWLPGNLLERGDRMTMAEGLEARPPFLDRELAAFGLALPDRFKVRRWTGKWIVRQWAAKLLPRHIIARKKWGFRVPLAHWFRGSMRDMLFGYLTNPRGLCGAYGNLEQIAALLDGHDKRRFDANLALWTLLSAEIWYQDIYLGQVRGAHGPYEKAIVG